MKSITQAYDYVTGVAGTKSEKEGLTKRELFAAMAMQGILSNPIIQSKPDAREISAESVAVADCLIEALNK